MQDVACFPALVAVGFAITAAFIDIRSFRIPNLLTYPALASGILYHTITGGTPGLAYSAAGLLLGFGIVFLLYLLGAMGAGDVKLIAAVGAWLGMVNTVYVFIVAGLGTAIYSLTVLAWRGGLREAVASLQISMLQLWTLGKHVGGEDRVEHVVRSAGRRKRLVPFALMVALGVIAVLVWVQWFSPTMGPWGR